MNLLADNCDLHLKVAADGLSGKLLPDEGFSYLLGGARATWGATKGKICFECKVGIVLQSGNTKMEVVVWICHGCLNLFYWKKLFGKKCNQLQRDLEN